MATKHVTYEDVTLPFYCDEKIGWRDPNKEYTSALAKTEDNMRETGRTLGEAIRSTIEEQVKNASNVNHPSHYNDGKIEVIDYIEDQNLNFHLGNVVKYVSRAGKKDKDKTIEDLKKARWYLDRYIEKLEGVKNEEK